MRRSSLLYSRISSVRLLRLVRSRQHQQKVSTRGSASTIQGSAAKEGNKRGTSNQPMPKHRADQRIQVPPPR